ncbi:hypothetical protein [Aneurinibacillus sp. REN35]|uniref:hypothetical protein n=1 Tax=Aneurinibacillus sp. REN35 TaxID=3237286 RepID=UPI003527AF4C
MNDITIEQEAFTYYKEGIMTWIYNKEAQIYESGDGGWLAQEKNCGTTHNSQSMSLQELEFAAERYEEMAWVAAAVEESCGRAINDYWDTG